jgi:two-component system CheB/CheR fusion protein
MTVEEKDASLEELRAANEEIQSSNEELQSINEELETAKEELQSTNEELTTVNEELQNRNFELLSINDDLRNVLTSVNIPIIILGKDMRIKRYTPMAERVLNLIPTDVGRPITDLKLKIDVPDIKDLIGDVIKTLTVTEREIADETGHWYRLQLRPYRTVEDRIEGVVISMLDINDVKTAAEALAQKVRELEDLSIYSQAILDTMHEAFVVLGGDNRIVRVNAAFAEVFGVAEQELVDASFFDIGKGRFDRSDVKHLLQDTGAKRFVRGVELDLPTSAGERRFATNARLVGRSDGQQMILVAVSPVE